jgi:membrane protease YdiL (CAAX protease family)
MRFIKFILKRPDSTNIEIILPFLSVSALFLTKNILYKYIALYSIFEEFIFRSLPFIVLPKNLTNSLCLGILSGCFSCYIGVDPDIYVFFLHSLLGFLYALSSRTYSPIEIILHRTLFNILIYNDT